MTFATAESSIFPFVALSWLGALGAYAAYWGSEAKPTLEELKEYGFDTNDWRVKPAEEPGRYRIERHILYRYV